MFREGGEISCDQQDDGMLLLRLRYGGFEDKQHCYEREEEA